MFNGAGWMQASVKSPGEWSESPGVHEELAERGATPPPVGLDLMSRGTGPEQPGLHAGG